MAEQLLRIHARFVHAGTGQPVVEPRLRVRFLDHDAFGDDILGESGLDGNGEAAVTSSTSRFRSGLVGSLGTVVGEKRPDLFCEVREDGKPVYRSKIAWDVPVGREDPVTKQPLLTIDLGTFEYRRGRGLEGDDAPGMMLRGPV
jgi:hypothetical protein